MTANELRKRIRSVVETIDQVQLYLDDLNDQADDLEPDDRREAAELLSRIDKAAQGFEDELGGEWGFSRADE